MTHRHLTLEGQIMHPYRPWIVCIALGLLALILFSIAAWFAIRPDKALGAEASFPIIIFQDEMPLAKWKGPHPMNHALSWEIVTLIACKEHGGYLVSTPDLSAPETIVHYTCLRAVNAIPGERKHGA